MQASLPLSYYLSSVQKNFITLQKTTPPCSYLGARQQLIFYKLLRMILCENKRKKNVGEEGKV